MSTVDLLSGIARVPISYFVYSAFSYYGGRHGGQLPGSWFVRALTALGRNEDAVRQTLYRMEQDGELIGRRARRTKFYRPSAYARAEIDAGTEKLFAARDERWDGQWTFVHVGLRRPAVAKQRERVIALLAVEGFASVDANLYAHPRRAERRLYEALPAASRREVVILRGVPGNAESTAALTALWKVGELGRRYAKVEAQLQRLERTAARRIDDADAFRWRFAVVFGFLGVAWDDPNVPGELLPPDWPGERARDLAARLYRKLLPGAVRYGDAIYAETEASTITEGASR
ncbi:MAG: hypothetical protein KF709_10875 [Gemmatimonadaceae bacterium]|nr:hypothetical protein [Gemmatimonadaceae bacterium]